MEFKKFSFGKIFYDAHISRIVQPEEVTTKLINWMRKPKNLLFIFGNMGTGKTYIAAALNNALEENKINLKCYNEFHFLSELRMCISQNDDAIDRIETICGVDFLIIDDLGSSRMNDWQKEMLFALVELRFTSGLPTIITSNLGYSELKETFHPRFASRIFAVKNTLIAIDGEDRRTLPEFCK
jgi:DNA replication protein DnaC